MQVDGRSWTFGDNVPTDEIVPSHLVFKPLDEIATHVLKTRNPTFPKEVAAGDILVAGDHFGQSSGRAIAPKAVKATGIACVVADSVARTFYRNCYEIGLPALQCDGVSEIVDDGDHVAVDLRAGTVENRSTGAAIDAEPAAPFLLQMANAGGLIPYASEGFPGYDRA